MNSFTFHHKAHPIPTPKTHVCARTPVRELCDVDTAVELAVPRLLGNDNDAISGQQRSNCSNPFVQVASSVAIRNNYYRDVHKTLNLKYLIDLK